MPNDQSNQYDVIGVRGIIGYFLQSLDENRGLKWVKQITNVFDSNQDTETYAGLGNVPQLREWIGRKQAKAFNEFSVKITNRDWESTLRIKNKDMRRDKTGQLMARVGDLATRAVTHDAALLSALMNTTSTTVTLPGTGTATVQCFDGQPLWSTTHKLGTQSLSNSITYSLGGAPVPTTVGVGTTTNPSFAVMALAIQSAIQQIYSFLDNEGQPLNELAQNFVVLAPISLSGTAATAVSVDAANFLGWTNTLPWVSSPGGKGKKVGIEVYPLPRLTYTDSVIVVRSDSASKTLIKQYEPLFAPGNTQGGQEQTAFNAGEGMVLKALADGSDNEFINNETLFSVEKSGMVGYGRFDQSCLVQLVS